MFWPKPVTQHCSIRNGKNSDGHAGKRSIVFKETQRRSISSSPASGCCSAWVQCLWGLQAFCHLEDKPATLRTLRMTRQGGRESLDPQHHRTAEWISWLWAHPDLPWGCFYKTKKKIPYHLHSGFLLPASKNILGNTKIKPDSWTGNNYHYEWRGFKKISILLRWVLFPSLCL